MVGFKLAHVPHVSNLLNAGVTFTNMTAFNTFLLAGLWRVFTELNTSHLPVQYVSLSSTHTLKVMMMLVGMKAVLLCLVFPWLFMCPVCRRPLQAAGPHYEAVIRSDRPTPASHWKVQALLPGVPEREMQSAAIKSAAFDLYTKVIKNQLSFSLITFSFNGEGIG